MSLVIDLSRYLELRWLDRFFVVPPAALASELALAEWLLGRHAPGLHTSALQMFLHRGRSLLLRAGASRLQSKFTKT